MLAIKAALIEKKKPKDVIVATIDTKTGKFRNVTAEKRSRCGTKSLLT